MKTLLAIVALVILVDNQLFAQVSKAKENAKEHKSRKSSGGSSDSDEWDSGEGGGVDFFFFVGDVFFRGIGAAHMHMLERKEEEPWIISADAQLTAAVDPSFGTVSFAPTIRGNWGLFSTQIRTNRLFETETLQTVDWQIVQLNFMSQEHVNLRYGIGFSHELITDQTHLEQYAGLELHFDERRINPIVNFRWSDDGFPRLELNAFVDWKLTSNKFVDIGVLSGYSFQRWYGEPFHMIMTGLTFRIE